MQMLSYVAIHYKNMIFTGILKVYVTVLLEYNCDMECHYGQNSYFCIIYYKNILSKM